MMTSGTFRGLLMTLLGAVTPFAGRAPVRKDVVGATFRYATPSELARVRAFLAVACEIPETPD